MCAAVRAVCCATSGRRKTCVGAGELVKCLGLTLTLRLGALMRGGVAWLIRAKMHLLALKTQHGFFNTEPLASVTGSQVEAGESRASMRGKKIKLN